MKTPLNKSLNYINECQFDLWCTITNKTTTKCKT